jgi:phosphoglycerate dehydrogenase-like enzyme
MVNQDSVEVLITLPFNEELLQQIQTVSPRLKITQINCRKPEDVPGDVWSRCEVLYTDKVLPDPERAPLLKWIQFHWAGVDHALDSPILKKPGLKASTLSGAAAPQLAEYSLAMLLALGHRLPLMMENQFKADWPRDHWERFLPRELHGSTVGLIGYGSISREVARLLQPFHVTILATKRTVMHPEDGGYTLEGTGDPQGMLFTRLYPPQALRSMLKDCDFVVLTLPLTPATRNSILAEDLAALKPGAFLVVVGRGGVIDQNALVEALKSHQVGGAAMDVFAEEPLAAENPLWKLPNVIISPHIAGLSPFYNERAAALFCENLKRLLAGENLLNTIDLEEGY